MATLLLRWCKIFPAKVFCWCELAEFSLVCFCTSWMNYFRSTSSKTKWSGLLPELMTLLTGAGLANQLFICLFFIYYIFSGKALCGLWLLGWHVVLWRWCTLPHPDMIWTGLQTYADLSWWSAYCQRFPLFTPCNLVESFPEVKTNDFDIRYGIVFRASPRQADVIIVAGTLTNKVDFPLSHAFRHFHWVISKYLFSLSLSE